MAWAWAWQAVRSALGCVYGGSRGVGWVRKGLVEVERRDFDVHEALLDAPQQVPVLVVLDKQLPAIVLR
jgi:hypothetical protein